jgi:hypothetical protein
MVPMLALHRLLATTLRGNTQYEHLDLVDARTKLPQASDYRDRHQAPGVYAVLDPAANEMHVRDSGTAKFYSKNKRLADGTVIVEGGR